MFGIDSSELAIIALVALVVIGPKDLPRVMRMVGNWLAKGRAMTRHVRAGFDTMMREAELEEMQKAWAAQNEAIMKATALPDLGLTDPLAVTGTDPAVNAVADDWMAPLAAETVDVAPGPATLPEATALEATAPKRRRAKPEADAGTPSKPRKRTPKPTKAPAVGTAGSE